MFSFRIATFFQRFHIVPFTPYLSQCCERLLQEKPRPTDERLVAMVRIQRIGERITDTLPDLDIDELDTVPFKASLEMALSTIRNELEAVFESLPGSAEENCELA
jgi:hypothetical protein